MAEGRLKKQIEFLAEIDKLKSIERRIWLINESRKENSAEHSWHLALYSLLLSEHLDKQVDILKTIKMVLIHDIIEIDAGDTFAYDVEANKTKEEREKKAADRLFNLLPEDQAKEFRNLWNEFELQKTPESIFANAMDRFQPLITYTYSSGRTLKENKITKKQALDRYKIIEKSSKKLNDFSLELLDKAVKNGYLKDS